MSNRISINGFEIIKTTDANGFQTALNDAISDPSIHYILYRFNQNRQLFFGLVRDTQTNQIASICYECLGRGLPAARDIQQLVTVLPSDTKFIDLCNIRRSQKSDRFYENDTFTFSTATMGLFARGDLDAALNMLIDKAIQDFKKIQVNSELHKSKVQTIGDLQRELQANNDLISMQSNFKNS